jgi:hypothetical protein
VKNRLPLCVLAVLVLGKLLIGCDDPYALNGKYSDTLPNHFKIRDRGNSVANHEACRRAWHDGGPPPLECVDIFEFVSICAASSGSPSPSVDVTVGVGAGTTSGDHFDPGPNDDGAEEAPEQQGAEPGAGET